MVNQTVFDNQTVFESISESVIYQLNIVDVLVGAGIAVGLAMFVLWLDRKRRRDPVKRVLEIRLDRLQRQTQAIRNGIFTQDNREYLRVFVSSLDRLSLLILENFGAQEYEMFSQQIDIYVEALNQRKDYSQQVTDRLLDFLSDLIRRY